jgi:segregation and condensation protein A
MTHTVAVRNFEGPLALLLELVERNQLPVTDISVAAITTQYLERIHALKDQDPSHVSEFLQLGARLLYIKSLALLPRESAAEQAQELAQLNLELDEYRRYQAAARTLGRLSQERSWSRPVVSRLPASQLPLPELDIRQLTAAFERTLQQLEPAREQAVIAPHLSQQEMASRLKTRLRQGGFELQELLRELRGRLEIVVTFLALLELMRAGTARLTQDGQFAPISVEPGNGPLEPVHA